MITDLSSQKCDNTLLSGISTSVSSQILNFNIFEAVLWESVIGLCLYALLNRLTVITALALLSAKSMPSLTLPRHTAKKRAPSIPESS